MTLTNVACCQLEVSETVRLLVQWSPTECGVSECDPDTSAVRRPWATVGCRAMRKKKLNFLQSVSIHQYSKPFHKAIGNLSFIHHFIHYYSALEAGLAGTRAQSCDRSGSGTLHPGKVCGGSLPLLSPAFRRSHFRRQVPVHPQRRQRS